MSSLWTPGGEVPIDRDREPGPAAGEPGAGASPPGGAEDPELAARMAEMRQQLVEAPAAAVIAQHVMALYELAALHLSEDEPRLQEAKLAIDAVESVLDGLEGRLGDAADAIAAALPQLKMAFVEASDRQRARPPEGA